MSAARVMSEGSRDRDRAGDEVRSAARPYAEGKKSHTKLDRYALFDLGRAHHLSAMARWMLASLCLLADFRAAAVSITYAELAEYTGDSRSRIPKTLHELEEAGLVKITLPFGPNREGEVVILAWDDIVIETFREREARLKGLASNRGRIADESRTNREPERGRLRERGEGGGMGGGEGGGGRRGRKRGGEGGEGRRGGGKGEGEGGRGEGRGRGGEGGREREGEGGGGGEEGGEGGEEGGGGRGGGEEGGGGGREEGRGKGGRRGERGGWEE